MITVSIPLVAIQYVVTWVIDHLPWSHHSGSDLSAIATYVFSTSACGRAVIAPLDTVRRYGGPHRAAWIVVKFVRLLRGDSVSDDPDDDGGDGTYEMLILSWLLMGVYVWGLPAIFRGM